MSPFLRQHDSRQDWVPRPQNCRSCQVAKWPVEHGAETAGARSRGRISNVARGRKTYSFHVPGSTSSTAPTPGSQAVTGLVSALQWYDEQARSNRLSYQSLRLFAITLAAAIPVLTTSGAPALATAIVGSTIVVAEGTQQVFRFHDRYIGFRSAWNALDREKRLYASRSGRYANNSAPEQTLAERVDEVLAEETARWATSTARSREVNV